MATQEPLNGSILELLHASPNGLTTEQVVEGMRAGDAMLSPRRIRNLLGEMVQAGDIARRRGASAGRGAPPFVYVPAGRLPAQLILDPRFGVENARIHDRAAAEIESGLVEEQDREQLRHAGSVLARIAATHLGAERHAAAVVAVASQLARENPVDLLVEMAEWIVDDLNQFADATRAAWRAVPADAQQIGAQLDARLAVARRTFQKFWRLDRPVGEDGGILNLPSGARAFFMQGARAFVDAEAARNRLRERVWGEHVVEEVLWGPRRHRAAAATDASVADLLLDHAPGSFIAPDPVALMASAAAMVSRSEGLVQEYQDFDVYPDAIREYSEAMAAERGLVITPMLRHVLGEQDMRHSRMAAMDQRQYDQDLRVALRTAKWRPVGAAPSLGVEAKPTIIFRDGRLFPLVHRLKDFENAGLYGTIVRRQVELFANALNTVSGSGPAGDMVYGAVVKNPGVAWLASLVFWYMRTRGVGVDGRAAVDNDDMVYFPPFHDTAVSHLLFFGLARESGDPRPDRVYVTFRALRRFSDIAMDDEESLPVTLSEGYDERPLREDDREDWEEYVRQRMADQKRRRRENPLQQDDYAPYTYLCARAGAAMCYAAPAAQYRNLVLHRDSGHFLLPRLEVSVRFEGDFRPRAERHLLDMLAWMADGGCELDRAHTQTGFDTGDPDRSVPILVPDVLVYAHEAAVFARDKLGEEVQDELHRVLAQLRSRSGHH